MWVGSLDVIGIATYVVLVSARYDCQVFFYNRHRASLAIPHKLAFVAASKAVMSRQAPAGRIASRSEPHTLPSPVHTYTPLLPPFSTLREKPATATGSGRIKPDRSWRQAGTAKAASPESTAAKPAATTPTADAGKSTRVTGSGQGGKVWPSTREEGRSGAEYSEYEQLLESTGDHSGERTRGSDLLDSASYTGTVTSPVVAKCYPTTMCRLVRQSAGRPLWRHECSSPSRFCLFLSSGVQTRGICLSSIQK